MFSVAEKRFIASEIEKLLLSLQHPEMPQEKPDFTLMVSGKEVWSYAEIDPNWKYDTTEAINPWNEVARDVLSTIKKNYPSWICFDCGKKLGAYNPEMLATFHMGDPKDPQDICGWCGTKQSLTQPRDYGYPKLEGDQK